jgi:hypothetical protein
MDDSISNPAKACQPEGAALTARTKEGAWAFGHALLFTGHMIDQAGREHARFPAWAESRARNAIRDAITAFTWARPGHAIALSGAASGGDLLFQECCEELGIPTMVLLALPRDEFEAASVAPAGPEWVRRYRSLLERCAPDRLHVMEGGDGLLEGATDNVWQRANLWMIEKASSLAPERVLLALWDGKTGDGPGGTEHFLQVARRCGVRILPVIPMEVISAESRPAHGGCGG